MSKFTQEDYRRGWCFLKCGCHAFVFDADVAKHIPLEKFEFCDKAGVYGVRLEEMEGVKHA